MKWAATIFALTKSAAAILVLQTFALQQNALKSFPNR